VLSTQFGSNPKSTAGCIRNLLQQQHKKAFIALSEESYASFEFKLLG